MGFQSDELVAWVRLDQTEGVGPETARNLLGAFGLPHHIFEASFSELQKVVPERVAMALVSPPTDAIRVLIDKTLEWAGQPGNHVLTLADSSYPKTLFEIGNPPPVLYAKGRIELLNGLCLAIVGSRNASRQGCADAENFAEALTAAGMTIVSGLALGIDAAAHRGGLRGDRSTIAVIGTGADIVYPARNRELAHRIADTGCLISEYPLGTPAIASNFPRRNRLISGLSLGVLVIEAAAHSGSLITARLGAEQGREVFAVPGSIHSPLSRGCHQLIRQGAKLVESARDILDELDHVLETPLKQSAKSLPADQNVSPITEQVLFAMGFDPVDFDTLAQRCGLDAAILSEQLLNLELEGRMESLPGGLFRRLKL